MSPELIELAETLGVTAEYLWAALLRQAPIDATLNLLGGFAFVSLWLFLVWKWPSVDDGDWPLLDPEVKHIIFGITAAVVVIIIFTVAPTIASGYFNPEYWALTEVLRALK